jgi:hypothetical protein
MHLMNEDKTGEPNEEIMYRKELVAMFMESPFYFDMMPRERLGLLRQHEYRFSIGGHSKFSHAVPQVVCHHREAGAETDKTIMIFVGAAPRQAIHQPAEPPLPTLSPAAPPGAGREGTTVP